MKGFTEGVNVMSVGRFLTSVIVTLPAVSNTDVMAYEFQGFAL
jgi:hypothetical protein